MSADNWSDCPRCFRRAQAQHAALLRRVDEGYGKLPVEEWDALREEAAKGVQTERTFREDYEFWLDVQAATVWVSYSGACQSCGLAIKFDDERVIEGVDQ